MEKTMAPFTPEELAHGREMAERRRLAKLQAFFYILLRDHLPFGTVEGILADHILKLDNSWPSFNEEKMAEYAASVVARLLK